MAIQMDQIVEQSAATPAESPLQMLPQDFSKKPQATHAGQGFKSFIARVITFGGAFSITVYATYEMYLIVSQGKTTSLQWGMVALFAITFVWIALAACAGLAGFLLPANKAQNGDADIAGKKTVLLMPIYNEDPSETCAALYSMGIALAEKGLTDNFEIFIISDSNNPESWVKETAAVQHLREALKGRVPVWYRRRHDNKAKKAGNVHEFVSRWGARYDFMLVLDADSLLSADTLKTLMTEMAADPKSGIIQTLPCLYRGSSLFARLQQFAGTIYGPIVAQGVTAWQGNDGNYWGHNAIIRVSAFAESAGLPTLGGMKPFAGDILSHDFVEAALMRRAGWSVTMLPTLKGSWEESPPSLSDVAVRDRRWAQGNIQHLAVLKAKGLRWPNRFHMMTGVMGYMASPFWFALILIGIATAVQIHFADIEYFTDELTLFPNWPVFDSEKMQALFIFTIGILLVPKVLGLVRAIFTQNLRKPLGVIRLILGTLVEIVFSVLYAPIFMLIHTKHIFDIFSGKDSGWSTQQRQARSVPWWQLTKQHFWHTVIGIVMTAVVYYFSPQLLIWLAPIILGLLLSIPLSALSGSTGLAQFFRWSGILNIPEEVNEPKVVSNRDDFAVTLDANIAPVNSDTVLRDTNLMRRHFSMVDAPPAAKRGVPSTNRIIAEHKIAEAHSIDELLSWLDQKERMAILSYPDMGELIAKLHK